MRTLMGTFLKGLLAFLPVFLTVYCAYAFGNWLNDVSNRAVQWLAPGLPDVPGLGIMLGAIAIFALGVLVSSRLTRWIYKWVESPLRHLPVVKDLYSALKQLTVLLAPQEQENMGKVVSVKHPNLEMNMVGLMMRNDVDDLDDAIASPGMVAVYLPMSYQLGGYTVFVPREWISVVDMPVETAMKNALTGWMVDEANTVVPDKST
ncbi:MAG: putative membrane protein [Gammaproteobacteria bacterium]|jgi:uncharacterized membrane protein